MLTYRDVDHSSAEYRRMLQMCIDNPMSMRLFEINWSGTNQYQRCIERDGFERQQTLLQEIRTLIAEKDARLKKLASVVTDHGIINAESQLRLRALSEPDFRRDCTSRRLVRIDNSAKIAEEIGLANRRLKAARGALAERAQLETDRASLVAAAERLTAALMVHHRTAAKPQGRADREAPAVPLKVEIVGLPDRKTTTEIGYNNEGEISSSTQVERDL